MASERSASRSSGRDTPSLSDSSRSPSRRSPGFSEPSSSASRKKANTFSAPERSSLSASMVANGHSPNWPYSGQTSETWRRPLSSVLPC